MKTDFCGSRRFALAAAAILLAATMMAHAEADYPARPITMVVPFAAGGGTDLVARVLAKKMGDALGQPVIVDNRGGAGGNIGNGAVAKARPDGYTILYNTSSIAISPSLYRKLGYDVTRDLAPVALAATIPVVLVANASVPAGNLQEFIAHARANSGKISYGSSGVGAIVHLSAAQFTQAHQIDATHVPYKGTGAAIADLLGGQFDFMTDVANNFVPYREDKRVKVLAVAMPRRIDVFPNVPTFSEAGVPAFEVDAWQGLMVPAGTPRAIVERLNGALLAALQDAGVRGQLAAQGVEPLGSTPEQYGAHIAREIARWSRVIEATGLEPQ